VVMDSFNLWLFMDDRYSFDAARGGAEVLNLVLLVK
jgi:hypothetical protein